MLKRGRGRCGERLAASLIIFDLNGPTNLYTCLRICVYVYMCIYICIYIPSRLP